MLYGCTHTATVGVKGLTTQSPSYNTVLSRATFPCEYKFSFSTRLSFPYITNTSGDHGKLMASLRLIPYVTSSKGSVLSLQISDFHATFTESSLHNVDKALDSFMAYISKQIVTYSRDISKDARGTAAIFTTSLICPEFSTSDIRPRTHWLGYRRRTSAATTEVHSAWPSLPGSPALSTSEGWEVNGHTTRYTDLPICSLACKLRCEGRRHRPYATLKVTVRGT